MSADGDFHRFLEAIVPGLGNLWSRDTETFQTFVETLDVDVQATIFLRNKERLDWLYGN